MLDKADIDLSKVISELTKLGIAATFFVSTATGVEKHIMDAHDGFRAYLLREGLHDYSIQTQGPAGKRELAITIFSGAKVIGTKISLYRPETKQGDPRFWIHKLSQNTAAWNLWALWRSKVNGLVAVNCSDDSFWSSIEDKRTELGALLHEEASSSSNPIADELLQKLAKIHQMGFVQNLRKGDTGVGFTLESLLGIAANSSRKPDYKGIELKAKRFSKANRVNLFSQVPLWNISECKSGLELVQKHGYFDPKRSRQALYTTVSNTPNSQSIYFSVDQELDAVFARKSQEKRPPEEIVRWELSRLERELETKHAETFWVTAKKRRGADDVEEFQYSQVTHTKGPILEYFGPLLESGVITMDFTIHVKENGKTRDHGYLFKIKPDKLDLLFPPPKTYDLGSI